MKGRMPNLAFRIMAHLAMPVRNLLMPPADIFTEIDIQPGHRVLDYGCGPGVFSVLAAAKAGPEGVVYALDNHPLALKMTTRKAFKAGLETVKTLEARGKIPLAGGCLDAILLLDVYHLLENPAEVLGEMRRVIRPDGRLFFSDHHLGTERVLEELARSGWHCNADSRSRRVIVLQPDNQSDKSTGAG